MGHRDGPQWPVKPTPPEPHFMSASDERKLVKRASKRAWNNHVRNHGWLRSWWMRLTGQVSLNALATVEMRYLMVRRRYRA